MGLEHALTGRKPLAMRPAEAEAYPRIGEPQTAAPSARMSVKGIVSIKRSSIALVAAASIQLIVAILSGSVSLLIDTLHNFGDAGTAGPLWIAFKLGQRKPSRRFTYGLGRVEDLAGLVVILFIVASAVGAAYISVRRFIHPQLMGHLWAVALASIVGFVGNELAARYRITGGREIGSAALVADGGHGRIDGFASLAVLVSALGAWVGLSAYRPHRRAGDDRVDSPIAMAIGRRDFHAHARRS
ncbi:MAG: hypothetical protein C5B57_08695 [Blastocatellia bacterium]|nr:MAG: hypothetical protein C5B57_08695 [Blastocatellia bacterium]